MLRGQGLPLKEGIHLWKEIRPWDVGIGWGHRDLRMGGMAQGTWNRNKNKSDLPLYHL